MLHRIRSASDPFFEAFRLALRDFKTYWTNVNFLPLKEKMSGLVEGIFGLASLHSKLCVKWIKQGWRTPIAHHARRKCERLQKEQLHASRNGPLTEEELTASNLQIAHATLGAVFDRVNIQKISTFAARMAHYQLEEGTPVFKHDLKAQDVIRLLEKRVPAVCISYKHTRRSRGGLPRDIARVQKAVSQAATQLSQNRLLFWCDVIGQTPQGVSWAEHGIDPFLCMPTLRIVSAELREEIDDSFWMTIERIAAIGRCGLLSYDEDDARLKFGPRDDGYFFSSNMSSPFEVAKVVVAKLICNPILYYRRARCEDDKLEVLKYAVSFNSVVLNLHGLQGSEAGLRNVVSDSDFVKLLSVICFEKRLAPPHAQHINRPHAEMIMGDGERWHGLEESFPALQVFESQGRELFNRPVLKHSSYILPVSPAVDNVTDVIFAPLLNIAWCAAMRMRVADFEELEDRFVGRVVSFRVATREEEHLLTIDKTIVGKQACFH